MTYQGTALGKLQKCTQSAFEFLQGPLPNASEKTNITNSVRLFYCFPCLVNNKDTRH